MFTLFPVEPGYSIMSVITSQPRPVPYRQHWTVPVSREETLAIREKFQRAGWRAPNHKPKTTKIVAWAKGLWDRYPTPGDHQVRVTDKRALRHCEHIGVDLDQHLLQSGPVDFETWIDWMHRTTKKKSHETVSQLWRWLCQAYSILARQPIDAYTLQ